MSRSEEAAGLVRRVEARRQAASAQLDPKKRAKLGQFFTPGVVADFMAALPSLPDTGTVRLLDPGAGVGSLAVSVIARAVKAGLPLTLYVTAFEVEERLYNDLAETLDDCRAVAARYGITVVVDLHRSDFVGWATENLAGLRLAAQRQLFDLVVMNPPYGKIGRSSLERGLLDRLGVEVPNLYAAFLALGADVLESGGQLVAITPRSFTNGPYFRSFRRFFLDRVRLERLHVVESRGTLFGDADVLQENIIFAGTRGARAETDTVVISTSDGYHDAPRSRTMAYTDLIHPDDPQRFVRIAAYDDDTSVAATIAALPATLASLDLEVSTGRVVDFRAREHLRDRPGDDTVPLIYPGHLRSGGVLWPTAGSKKPNALVWNEQTDKLLLPAGTYVLVNRFSAKEEYRRVVAAIFDPNDMACSAVGFENHLNVYHCRNRGLPRDLARGLCLWLNSTVVDQFVRQFNGHTQVNATDLRSLRYPSHAELASLGAALGTGLWPEQDKIDQLVGKHIAAVQEWMMAEDSLFPLESVSTSAGDTAEPRSSSSSEDPRVRRVQEARVILRGLNFDAERCNERSALVLLALLDLPPDKPWSAATNPRRRTVEILDWLRQHYDRNYAPNTRETIRRFTLHQFAEAALVVLNPDAPDRPTNSPKSCYQIEPRALDLVRHVGEDDFPARLRGYLADAPGLQDLYARARELVRIPVTLPDGSAVTLSPGGQNPLLKQMIEDFCAYHTPGGQVLYVGDAGDKWMIHEQKQLESLGVRVDRHGKMPDLVVYMPDRNWLVLMEAAPHHGPVDEKRHGELKRLFKDATPGLVFVTCFPSRSEMRSYLTKIAWETEVWCADDPTHIIHFNGERFLGPYE